MLERYSRQILFSEIGEKGQRKLQKAKVLIIGCGALGTAHAEKLARAGVGFIRIADRDLVEFSNLQRQTLFEESDAQKKVPKAIAAKKRLKKINSSIKIEALVTDVNNSNIESIIEDIDIVLDGTDNFQTRYLINDACVKHGKIWIYGAVVSSYGATMTIIPQKTPCLRCIFEEMPSAASSPTCETAGIIQPIVSIISAIQTTEAIKILVGKLDKLHKSLLQIDIWTNEWRKVNLHKPQSNCKCCALKQFDFLSADWRDFATILCGRNAVQILPANKADINLKHLAEKLSKIGQVTQNEYLIRLKVEGYELTIFDDARAIIHGTENIGFARSLYSKYVGV
ncbi:MAG: ThiF family adenylyltransferase [Pyrinomonadaceae bacterium]|nr:ThiF family adenylyltransferase [Pyrinomonadaceae bacterium]MCX7639065.1 ThiF family adenylyltransferase [Pyrinomonadaceae bacterium]MDW8303714.1 ThiF family adenylyltransferase [Acidobacteriota bacterium]